MRSRAIGAKSRPSISRSNAHSGGSTAELAVSECRACGACCSYSAEWPRFSLESEADLERIPAAHIDAGQGRMRCDGNRCSALAGEVGIATGCTIYAVRPDVCRACLPGDDACRIARRHFGLEHDAENAWPRT
ncbi:MAG: YkgJ family cysteine cluster protein [Xanthobacteraceae bacterium]